MRLAQPDPRVDEERVVRLARLAGDGDGGGVRQPVVWTDDEGLERIVRAEKHVVVVPDFRLGDDGGRLGRLEVVLADETDREQPTGDGLGRVSEVLHAASFQVLELDLFTHQQLERAVADLDRVDVVEPVSADLVVILPEVRENLVLEIRIKSPHRFRLEALVLD